MAALQGEPADGYDPLMGWGQYGHPLFQSTLLARDEDLVAGPDLAKSWSLSADRLTWTVVIRADAKFSDGSPLTAEDVAFTFNKAATVGGIADLTVLENAELVASDTIKFHLKHPRITFLENFITLGIVPAKSYGGDYGRHPVGSGPYRMVQWDEGQQLIVEANPYYYGPKPAFRRVTFLFTGEDASFAAAQAGRLDIVTVPPSLAGKAPTGMRRIVVDSVDNRGLMFPTVPNTGRKNAVGMPIGNDVTADPAIRHAINVAIDRAALVAGALDGFGRPAYGPADGLPWSNPEARMADADPERAKEILAEAGWKDPGHKGVLEKNGRQARFQILYFASDSVRQALALMVSEKLKPLGIAAEPVGKSLDDVRRLMNSEAVVFGYGSHNPLEVYSLYDGTLAGNGTYNAGYYVNPTVDEHFAAAQNAPSVEASLPQWRLAEWDGNSGFGMKGDAAWAWMVNLKHVYFANKCLDVGKTQVEPHGHGWPITAGILHWRWICP
ncbi:MAG: ABC transporter substrate-binding protein [Telmatospirillum sp.]|nr:ABC transporter substrate-binding protein [Telmatospirillum sp.]